MTAPGDERYGQAIRHAGLNVLERALVCGVTLEAAARRFIRNPLPYRITPAGGGASFPWYYGEEDLPAIVVAAIAFERAAQS